MESFFRILRKSLQFFTFLIHISSSINQRSKIETFSREIEVYEEVKCDPIKALAPL